MDNFDNNKGTPTKRTGSKDVFYEDNDHDEKDIFPEIEQPNPSTATPSIPPEMPVREMK